MIFFFFSEKWAGAILGPYKECICKISFTSGSVESFRLMMPLEISCDRLFGMISGFVYSNTEASKLLVSSHHKTLKELIVWGGMFTQALQKIPEVIKKGIL